MLTREPHLRLSSADALAHDWFKRTSEATHVRTLQRATSYQRLVEFNALRARAQRRWSKVRVALKTLWSFNEPLRKQIEAERQASAAARNYLSQVVEEEAQLTRQMNAVQRQQQALFASPPLHRWRGKPRAVPDSDQKATAWLKAGEDRRRKDTAKYSGV
eukprot:COSAG02_NODE_14852_length_1229_cov_3.684488_2_plen_160_part_00